MDSTGYSGSFNAVKAAIRRIKRGAVDLVHLVCLVCFVYLVDLVHLVSFVQPKKQDKLNKPNKQEKPAGTLLGVCPSNPSLRGSTSCWRMQGRRFQETGGVFSAIRRGFLGTENDTDAGRSFAAVERHYSDRLLARIIHECRREAFETEARCDGSHARTTQAYWLQSVEEGGWEPSCRARGSGLEGT